MKVYRHEAEKMNRLALLEQRKWWRTSDGRTVKVKKMDANHQVNLSEWLIRNAVFFAQEKQRAAFRESMFVEARHGDDAPDGVFSAMSQWEGEAQRAVEDPARWMRERPLYRRLLELTR